MADIEDVIRQSIAGISDEGGEGESSGDEGGGSDEHTDDNVEGEVPAAEASDEKAADAQSGAGGTGEDDTTGTGKKATADEPAEAESLLTTEDKSLLSDLRDLGIKIKDINVNNRMPYKRHLRVLVNEAKRLRDRIGGEHTKELTAREERAAKAEARAKEADEIDRLAEQDPDWYVALLAALHPEKYGKFVQRLSAAADDATRVTKEDPDPEPGPDVKYEDGTLGYSPEQFNKVRAWDRRQVAKQVTTDIRKEYDSRLSPIENKTKAEIDFEQRRVARAERTQQAVAGVFRRWGKDRVESHQKEIFAWLDKNPKSPLEDAVAAVLLPMLESDRAKVRSEVMKELDGRPAAASKKSSGTGGGGGGTGGGSGDPITDAIKRSIAAAGLK